VFVAQQFSSPHSSPRSGGPQTHPESDSLARPDFCTQRAPGEPLRYPSRVVSLTWFWCFLFLFILQQLHGLPPEILSRMERRNRARAEEKDRGQRRGEIATTTKHPPKKLPNRAFETFPQNGERRGPPRGLREWPRCVCVCVCAVFVDCGRADGHDPGNRGPGINLVCPKKKKKKCL